VFACASLSGYFSTSLPSSIGFYIVSKPSSMRYPPHVSRISPVQKKPGYLSRYSDWLRDGRPRGRSSSRGRVENFLFSTLSRPTLGPTQPPTQWVPGLLSSGVKRKGRETDHSPQTNAEVKKMWIYISTPPYTFMVYFLIS
jgi:hypothetical protein